MHPMERRAGPRTLNQILSLSMTVLALSRCQSARTVPDQASSAQNDLIRHRYSPGELTRLCDEALKTTEARLAKMPQSLPVLESTLADLTDTITPLNFMGYVSKDSAVHAEGSACEEKASQYLVSVFTRRDLYKATVDFKPSNAAEKRLKSETLKVFEKNGLKLSEAKLTEFKELKKQLTVLESQFTKNLNDDDSRVAFSADELRGTPESFLKRLVRRPDGKLLVTTKSTDYLPIAENAQNPETRKKMLLAYENRAAEKNSPILEQAVLIRQKLARLAGYGNWADYQIHGRMAKDGRTVSQFLASLKSKLAVRTRSDLDKLLALKRELEPASTQLNAWDIRYLSYQLKKREFSLDDEKIREYFPADRVIQGMFEAYSKLLNVRFEEVSTATTWAENVKLYKVIDGPTQGKSTQGQLIGYFYTDFFPRDGKYGHAAAFPLKTARQVGDHYQQPVSAIVANFNPPANGKPSLLNHAEVETVFHEFGHIMHQVLTRAPFASLSGTSVAQDFVEAPSQMLEEWVWSPELLSSLSGHYQDTTKPLPDALLKQLIAAQDFNQGYDYSRQLVFGLFDMDLHTTTKPTDPVSSYARIHRQVMGVEPIAGGHFPATFGHLMGGYDAGYYGYLWSKVYALDMFTRFQREGLLNPRTGLEYRQAILEQGNMRDASDLLRKFLSRKPNSKAFFKKLGIGK